MLKFGAVELFKDDSNTDQHLEGLDLDTVLKEAETRVQEEEAGAGHELLSQFKVGSSFGDFQRSLNCWKFYSNLSEILHWK